MIGGRERNKGWRQGFCNWAMTMTWSSSIGKISHEVGLYQWAGLNTYQRMEVKRWPVATDRKELVICCLGREL